MPTHIRPEMALRTSRLMEERKGNIKKKETDAINERILMDLKTVQKVLDQTKKAMGELGNNKVEQFSESVDELYLESNRSEANKTGSFIRQMIIHLFKLKYGKDLNSHDHLRDEIENFRDEVIMILRWDTMKKLPNIIRLVVDDIDLDYQRAVRKFKRTKNLDNDYLSIQNLPNQCPWILEELMDNSIDDLLLKL